MAGSECCAGRLENTVRSSRAHLSRAGVGEGGVSHELGTQGGGGVDSNGGRSIGRGSSFPCRLMLPSGTIPPCLGLQLLPPPAAALHPMRQRVNPVNVRVELLLLC